MSDAPRIFESEYYERMRSLEAGGWWNAGMRDACRLLLETAELPSRGLLLDVGCGSGQTMAWFRRLRPGWRSVGVDVAMEGLAAARRDGSRVALASALALPLPDAAADLILTLDVLQHLPLDGGDRTALAEMARVLRPGGWLFLRTNAQAFPRTSDDPEHDFHRYRPGELRKRLAGAGLRVVRLSRLNALLGLAEIPRELAALRRDGDAYHGILAEPPEEAGRADRAKRAWLRWEARLVREGVRLPLGRSIVALCRREEPSGVGTDP